MATKRGKRSGVKAGTVKTRKASAKPAAKAKGKARPARRAAARASGPSLLDRAEALRDAVQRSKLTAPDPWSYTPKARAWAERAQVLVERVSRAGDTAATRQALDALAGEVQRDREFQEARRLF